MPGDSVVIVGGGESAACAIGGLRGEGYGGPIVWLCEEPFHAYERPTLSKQLLASAAGAPMAVVSAELLADPALDIRLNTAAVRLDPASRMVTLSTGETTRYAALLLATGAEARKLDLPGHDPSRWLTLRRAADLTRLRPHLAGQSRIAVIGAGLIGLEVAAAARLAGAEVTVIESRERPLARVLPPDIAEIVLARHRRAGVAFAFNAAITAVASDASGEHITLASEQVISADLVLVAIGSVPRTDLAESAGILVANGIVVDAQMRTSQAGIWASGDCCSVPLGGGMARLENWEAARLLGEVAGRNMAGGNLAAGIVPWFWSDQYELGIQGVGMAPANARTVRRDLGPDSALTFSFCPQGRLHAVHGVGPETAIAKPIKRARQFVRDGATCDLTMLQDPGQPIWSAFASPLPQPLVQVAS